MKLLLQLQQQRHRCWTWGSRRGFQSRSFMKRKIAEAAGAAAGVLELVCCCGVVCGLCIVRVAAASFSFKSQTHSFKSHAPLSHFFIFPRACRSSSRGSLRSERLTSGTAPAFHNMHVLHTAVPCFSVAATSSVAEECSTAHAHSRAYAHQHTHVFLLHSSAPALVFGR